MDLIATIEPLLNALLIILPLVLGVIFLKSPYVKGWLGECVTNLTTTIFLNSDKYHLIKNVTLPTALGGTTQIDHIVISAYGIFVVETKNMKGWIYREEDQAQWTQVHFKQRYSFQNPLRQNYKHIKALTQLLSLDDSSVFSVIVFMGKATFKTPMPANVVHPWGYIRFVKSKREIIFSDDEVAKFKNQIEQVRLSPSWQTTQEHIQYVKRLKNQPKIVESSPNCPLCSSEMVKREAKRGRNAGQFFWGCSRYPHCKGTCSISTDNE